MKQVSGVLKKLGSANLTHGNVGSSTIKYNTIQIGNNVLQKIVTAQSLDDFLTQGLGQEVTLFLNKNMLIGIKLQDGQIYYWKRSFSLFLFAIILSIAQLGFAYAIGGLANNFVIPMIVMFAVIFFTSGSIFMQRLIYEPKLSSAGGVPLRG
ncbi:hypothetical protein [Janthinobacterium psychrotolerans]|uniref:hypothetical protein n=1 Tax=Janthinobacterium psychrotolerans TaxID=1747903 RepID=UPI0012379E10|nr:hypothetical protein [Janthinobacterium psychrotolerans]